MFHFKEGETPLDDLSGLKIKIPNITRNQLDEYEAANVQKGIQKYYGRKKRISFEIPFFQKLHKEMFGEVWKWAGDFRDTDTNIGSPANRVREDLQILQMDLKHFSKDMEGGAIFHHRAVMIHPYKGGNGRWSRFISDLWLRKEAGIIVNWPEGMGEESEIRQEYLAALRAADGLDYDPLLNIYKRISKAK